MLYTFHWFRGEVFASIVDDLGALPAETPVIAEGFRLLPPLVHPLLTTPRQAVWLLPTPRFRRTAFDTRGWDIPERTSAPTLARHNLLERDRMFTERLAAQTRELALSAIEVDIGMTEDQLTNLVRWAIDL